MVQTPTDGRTWKVFFETTQSETGWTVNCLNSLGHAALTTFWHRVEALYPDTWEWQVGVVRLDLPLCFACPLCCYSRTATFSILFDLHDACGCFGLLAYGSHDACDKLSKQASPRLWCISSSLGPSKWSPHVNVYTGCLDCFLSIFYHFLFSTCEKCQPVWLVPCFIVLSRRVLMHVSITSMLQRFGKGRDGAPWAWRWHRNLSCSNQHAHRGMFFWTSFQLWLQQ